MERPHFGQAGCLNGVDALTDDDGWAVGEYGDSDGSRAMILHWDGVEWKPVAHPKPPRSTLIDVAGVSSSDVWAVGYRHLPDGSVSSLMEHWDGSRWSVVSGLPTRPQGEDLVSISVDSPDDAWAVGGVFGSTGSVVRINMLHWNGQAWSTVDFPANCPDYFSVRVRSVVAVSPVDAWAVGQPCTESEHARRPLLAHWDGDSWTRVAGAKLPYGLAGGTLNAVAASASDDIWAAGVSGSKRHGVQVPVAEHFDGSTWTAMALPRMPEHQGTTLLQSVALASDGSVWVGGTDVPRSGAGQFLLEHFDGTSWQVVQGVQPPTGEYADATIWDLSATAGGALMAIGTISNEWPATAFAESWSGDGWQSMPLRTPHTTQVEITDVSAANSADAWSVGVEEIRGRPYAMHWDGESWSRVVVPTHAMWSELTVVDARTADDVWAVGDQRTGKRVSPLIEHWDGSSWQRVPAPRLPHVQTLAATGISADAPDDVWVTLELDQGDPGVAVLHWDGHAWSSAPSPPQPKGTGDVGLSGVMASAPNDVWVVGSLERGSNIRAYAARWDGSSWHVLRGGPFLAAADRYAFAIAATSSTQVYVGGIAERAGRWHPYIATWNGSDWRVQAVPGPADGAVRQLSATGAGEVWAVGTGGHPGTTFVDRWDGTDWVDVPGIDNHGFPLRGPGSIVAVGEDDVWVASDFQTPAGSTVPVAAHWDGSVWSRFSVRHG